MDFMRSLLCANMVWIGSTTKDSGILDCFSSPASQISLNTVRNRIVRSFQSCFLRERISQQLTAPQKLEQCCHQTLKE
jgi:hypothetical protein